MKDEWGFKEGSEHGLERTVMENCKGKWPRGMVGGSGWEWCLFFFFWCKGT